MAAASRAGRSAAAGAACLAVLLVCTPASAHRLDEYLQAARIDIEPDQIVLDLELTPGVAVADRILADIDRDGDGMLSSAERQDYSARVLDGIVLRVDHEPLIPRLTASAYPAVDDLLSGTGTIRLRSVSAVPRLVNGAHTVFYRNTLRRDISAYAANALVPQSEQVRIVAQRRDQDQSNVTIAFAVGDDDGGSLWWWLGGLASCAIGAICVMRPKTRLWKRRCPSIGAIDSRA
jgi:hypothetical protein